MALSIACKKSLWAWIFAIEGAPSDDGGAGTADVALKRSAPLCRGEMAGELAEAALLDSDPADQDAARGWAWESAEGCV